jgi:hypothetical protein
MRRRTFVAAALASIPAIAHAQTPTPAPVAPAGTTTPVSSDPIDPATPLEFAFVAALDDARMRPIFRRYLLDTSVVLALAEGSEPAPREVQVRTDFTAGAIFTTTARMDAVLGADAPRIILNGRAALERLRGKNAVINFRLVPMLTLDDEDITAYLATEGSASAGPTQ